MGFPAVWGRGHQNTGRRAWGTFLMQNTRNARAVGLAGGRQGRPPGGSDMRAETREGRSGQLAEERHLIVSVSRVVLEEGDALAVHTPVQSLPQRVLAAVMHHPALSQSGAGFPCCVSHRLHHSHQGNVPQGALGLAALALLFLTGTEGVLGVGARDDAGVIRLIQEGALVILCVICGLLHRHISIEERLPQTVIRDAGGTALVAVKLAVW